MCRLVQRGGLPGFKDGGQSRFNRTETDSWINVKTDAAGVQPANNGVTWSDENLEDWSIQMSSPLHPVNQQNVKPR